MTGERDLRPAARRGESSRITQSTGPARKVLRSIHEGARDLAREIAKTDAYQNTGTSQ
jgi:hypothetical protein